MQAHYPRIQSQFSRKGSSQSKNSILSFRLIIVRQINNPGINAIIRYLTEDNRKTIIIVIFDTEHNPVLQKHIPDCRNPMI